MIASEHLNDLRKSGLADSTIEKAGIYSVRPADIAEKLGWDSPQIQSMYAIPYPNNEGFERYKLIPPIKEKDGHEIKYLQRKGSPVHLYIPPQVLNVLNNPRIPLTIVEGEKKTLRLLQEGYHVIGIGGIWSWSQEDLDKIVWQGRIVNFSPDSDIWQRPDLLKAVYALARELEKRGANVVIFKLPEGKEKTGVDDYLQQGHSVQELFSLPTTTTKGVEFEGLEGWYINSELEKAGLSTLNTFNTYPVLKPETLYGLAGDIVRTIELQTEADNVALLSNLLVAFGNVVGDEPHFIADGSRHSMRLFAVHVGETSKGRKGTAWTHISRLFESVIPNWANERTTRGLSSGEGLIWAVRDPIEQVKAVKQKGKPTEYETIITDAGVSDKRLLVLESEFSSVLKVSSREGSTLSSTIRQAWDTGNLRTLTKNSPARATGAHISILGHITKDELLRYLDSTEAGNGFGNRFLWICVRRSKCLPEGGKPINIEPLVSRLKRCIDFAQTVGEMKRDEESRKIWYEVYPSLSEGKAGLFGALTSRAEAQVMRLACIYALLDCSLVIRTEHLLASLALWEYVEASVKFIFGEATGDPIADRILRAVECSGHGLSRRDIYKGLFSGNYRAERIDRAITSLLSCNRVRIDRQTTSGRPVEVILPA